MEHHTNAIPDKRRRRIQACGIDDIWARDSLSHNPGPSVTPKTPPGAKPAPRPPGPSVTPKTPPGAKPAPRPRRRNKNPKERRPQQQKETPAENIEKLGTPDVPLNKSNIHCLTIIGQVEGHLTLPPQNKTTKYEHVMPQLVALELNPEVEGVIVVLNTVGGDVEAGLALAEMINSLSKPSVSLVLGGGHSIGVPIATACHRSFIAHSATMTIHPIRLSGLVIGVPQTYEYLDKMQDRVVKFVVNHSKITEEKYRELMFRTGDLARDIGTVLVGADAVEIGLIDEVGGMAEALNALKKMTDARKLPTTLGNGDRSES